MKNKRKNGTYSLSFIFFNIFLCIMLIAFFLISIADNYLHAINWPKNVQEIIGTITGVLTTIVSLIVSIIGIAISLQNDEYYGVKISKIYVLRKDDHYSIRFIIITSVILCALHALFYAYNLTVASIGSFLVTISFSIIVVLKEIPIMSKDEGSIKALLKSNFIYCYETDKEASKDLKDSIRFLLYEDNLSETFLWLKNDGDDEYNKYLLINLLELQQNIAFDLRMYENDNNIRKTCDSLMKNIIDVSFRRFDIDDNTYKEIIKQRHLLTRVLFSIQSIPAARDVFEKNIEQMLDYLCLVSKEQDERGKLLSSLIITVCAYNIKDGVFDVLKLIRKKMSVYFFRKDEQLINYIFAIISFEMYYLCECDDDFPKEISEKILSFISESNIIEDDTKIKSWKMIFKEFNDKFYISFKVYYDIVYYNINCLRYHLHSDMAKMIIMDDRLIACWYLTNLLNSHVIINYNYSVLTRDFSDKEHLLKSYGEKCFDLDKSFHPTDEMIRIVSFFDNKNNPFGIFLINEKINHTFFDLVNRIKARQIDEEITQIEQIDNKNLQKSLKAGIENAVRNEWGFDTSLELNTPERCFNVITEKFLSEESLEKMMIECFVDGIFNDIFIHSLATNIYNDNDFELNLKKLLKANIKYITSDCKYSTMYYINDKSLLERFKELSEKAELIKSKIFNRETLICEKGFSFNFELTQVNVRNLRETELADEMEKYRREDGQYVYEGTFLPREKIEEIIIKKFIVVLVVFHYSISSSEDTLFNIFSYLDKPQDKEDD